MSSYQQSEPIPCDEVYVAVEGVVRVRRIQTRRLVVQSAPDIPLCFCIAVLAWLAALVGIVLYCVGNYKGHFCCEAPFQPRDCWSERKYCYCPTLDPPCNDCGCVWSTNDRLRLWGRDLMLVGFSVGAGFAILSALWTKFRGRD